MNDIQDIVAALEVVIKMMVDKAAAVSLKVSDTSPPTIRIVVDKSDVGKLIGQQGRTARSLRVILQAMAMTHNLRLSLDIDQQPETTT
jgi:predicted RNA-binding protein YlqC (UPF0109 family)